MYVLEFIYYYLIYSFRLLPTDFYFFKLCERRYEAIYPRFCFSKANAQLPQSIYIIIQNTLKSASFKQTFSFFDCKRTFASIKQNHHWQKETKNRL